MYKRTHTCGDLNKSFIGREVNLNGWVNTSRLHGKIVFVDLRDRYGKTQIVFDQNQFLDDFDTIKKLSFEDVISIKGVVKSRDEAAINPKMRTGAIEVVVTEFSLLNEAATLPFVLKDRDSSEEPLRLKYRYLELRFEELQENLIIRHKTYQAVRRYLSDNDFLEVETPILMKSTPEGARDFLVPSRIHKGKFYALPQSPQIYKQILMISGYDRYFQIVKCFRDEDLRADRQPEFTQIDIEMSFIDEEIIFTFMENLTRHVFKSVQNLDLPNPFPRITYNDAMERYGSDKPDTRYGMELINFKPFSDKSDFNAFSDVDSVKAIIVSEGAKYSRKIIEGLTEDAKKNGAKGLAWMKLQDGTFSGGISKFFVNDLQIEIIKNLQIKNDDLLLIIGDEKNIVLKALGKLRTVVASMEELYDKDDFKPLWVTEFPMFDYDVNDGRYVAMHHPFTAPRDSDVNKLDKDPSSALSRGYDLTMNGHEIAGGSIRIHSSEIQEKVFSLLGLSQKEAVEKFGFLVEALRYGAPPHGGIAFGFDRLVMLLAGTDNIRNVIAFPKTTSATSLMDESPSRVDSNQLKDLGLKIEDN
ncbi:MAG: aspartate--tRNA ligase [bacterium TMED80]|nr:MAG: aspartate--tRNA ligase [bacterium TMED80]